MNFSIKFLTISFLLIFLCNLSNCQFWKLNQMNENERFEMETRATMPSGICYKKISGFSNNPELRLQTISICCEGYEQNIAHNILKCEPICKEDCTNGICIAPGECECYPRYVRKNQHCEKY